MQAQLERSMSVREQQRRIIEARSKGIKEPANNEVRSHPSDAMMNGPKTSRHPPAKRKGPPPGLSITAPSHEQFAHERVIQSAPLHQTFTGLGQRMQPLSRQVLNQPSNLSQTSSIHHVPAQQTANRLPPIADVFSELQPPPTASRTNSLYPPHSPGHPSQAHSHSHPPLPSPSFPPSTAHASHPPQSAGRPREYASAEEAIQSMTGGREDLVPRLVHYGGHQPPTPPSPPQHMQHKQVGLGVSSAHATPSGSTHDNYPISRGSATAGAVQGRRRDRDEYEKDVDSPPLGKGPQKRGPFGEGRDSPETIKQKKDRFMSLCSEAWDLFHN